jgi:hypothetical protein
MSVMACCVFEGCADALQLPRFSIVQRNRAGHMLQFFV